MLGLTLEAHNTWTIQIIRTKGSKTAKATFLLKKKNALETMSITLHTKPEAWQGKIVTQKLTILEQSLSSPNKLITTDFACSNRVQTNHHHHITPIWIRRTCHTYEIMNNNQIWYNYAHINILIFTKQHKRYIHVQHQNKN